MSWITNYSDVYDTATPNIEAGLSYNVQEIPDNHLLDVAIRRTIILDLGLSFNKKGKILQVRSEEEGVKVSPHKIPFHLPNMIYRGKIKYKGEEKDLNKNPSRWVKLDIPNSIEQFYQQNKVIGII